MSTEEICISIALIRESAIDVLVEEPNLSPKAREAILQILHETTETIKFLPSEQHKGAKIYSLPGIKPPEQLSRKRRVPSNDALALLIRQ